MQSLTRNNEGGHIKYNNTQDSSKTPRWFSVKCCRQIYVPSDI